MTLAHPKGPNRSGHAPSSGLSMGLLAAGKEFYMGWWALAGISGRGREGKRIDGTRGKPKGEKGRGEEGWRERDMGWLQKRKGSEKEKDGEGRRSHGCGPSFRS